MDAEHFDTLARSLSDGRSRRGALAAVVGSALGVAGLDETDAKHKKHKKKKRKTPGGCPVGEKLCQGACISVSQCCTDGDCGARRICAGGLCVTGQGTCASGSDICAGQGATAFCGQPRTDCVCLTSTTNQTRCGLGNSLVPVCGECLSDADCAGKHPGIPGVFCAQAAGSGDCVCKGSTFCSPPCPG